MLPRVQLILKNGGDADTKMMTGLVYIASPYAGDVEANLTFAGQAGRYCMMQGGIPVIPHMMYPAFLDDTDPAQRGLGIEMGLRLMEVCDCVWICGEHISAGMKQELAFANGIGKEVRFVGRDEITASVNERQEMLIRMEIG